MRRNWIKLYVDQCLRGSMMIELDPAERYVWFGFLLLAGDCAHEGLICATENSGYTDIQISDLLKVDVDLVKRAKRKFIKYEKVQQDENGIIQILKWHLYQSEYLRQKSYRVKLQGEVTNSSPSPSISSSYKNLKEEIITQWNEFAQRWQLRPIQDIEPGSTREAHLRARMKKKGFSLETLLQKIEKQPFLLGQNDKAWTITFDWILCPSNYTKIIEEQYPARTPRNEVTRDRQVGANKRPVSIEEKQAQEKAKEEFQIEGKK